LFAGAGNSIFILHSFIASAIAGSGVASIK
jgi:hypothetical protein